VDIAAFSEQVKSALGLDEPWVAQTVAHIIQVVAVLLLSFWLASWAGARIRRVARASGQYTDVTSMMSRSVSLAIVGVSIAISLAIIGVSPTAIAAVLGALTLGISVSLQDVGRSFVTGLYLLIERPFRIGDWIRVGDRERRVEEIGVRLIQLRAEGGDRILVPSNVVFSSVVQNSSLGTMDRRSFAVEGIDRPVAEIEDAIAEALAGLSHLSDRQPDVNIVQTSPEGTTAEVTVEFDRGQRVAAEVIVRLHTAFPEARIGTVPAAGDS
jgi:small-conductance mechanosensitive channel